MSELFYNSDANRKQDEQDQHTANRLVVQARLLPILRKVLGYLEESDLVFHGFAVVREESGELCSNYRGYCIYDSLAAAERIVELTARGNKDKEEAAVKILPVTVSVKEGLVYN